MDSTGEKFLGILRGDEAKRYAKNIVKKYNESPKKWDNVNERIFFAIGNDKTNLKQAQTEIEINNLEDLYMLKYRLVKEFLKTEENVILGYVHSGAIYAAEKLRIPVDLLNDIFNKFAENCHLADDFFASKEEWEENKNKFVYVNKDFVYFCLVIYNTLYGLYGENAYESEKFGDNIKKLFNDERIPGFRKLVSKLVNFDKFCDCCRNFDKVGFYSQWQDIPGLSTPDYVVSDFEYFQKKICAFGLNILDLAKKSIEIVPTVTKKTSKDKKIKEENVETPKLKNQKKVLIWKNLILILLIGLTALASLLFGLNIKFLFIAVITNPLSIIITVVAVALFLGLTIYANKVKAIRLEKLCCGKESHGKSFFNLYKNIDDGIPNLSENLASRENKWMASAQDKQDKQDKY